MLTAHVIAEANIQSDGMGSFHQRIDVATEKIEAEDKTSDAHVGVRLNIYSQANPPVLKALPSGRCNSFTTGSA